MDLVRILLPLCVAAVAASQSLLLAVEPVTSEVVCQDVSFKVDGKSRSVTSEVLKEYADGSMLLQTEDGQLWTLNSPEIIERKPLSKPFSPLTADQICDQFRRDPPVGFPAEFELYQTKHFVIAYNTSDIYASWAAELFEKIYRGFYNYWKSRGIKLEEPRFPLVAVIFRDRPSYLVYAEREVGESAQAMIGYYNMRTNRMAMYDLTGVDGLVPANENVSSQAVINQILSRPEAERTVATIVHEAVHQIAFNSGLQTRLADNPLWLSEGMAMFFETPDGNARGWRTIGNINYHNLQLFARYAAKRPEDSLTTLIADDKRFRSTDTASAAYAESWALTYYLLRTKKKDYAAYIQAVSVFEPLEESTQRERIDLFKQHFGDDLVKFDREFLSFIARLR